MKVIFRKTFLPIAKKGDYAIIDRALVDKDYASGVKFRVVNIWKKPRYLDSGWFIYPKKRSQKPQERRNRALPRFISSENKEKP